MPLDQSNRLPRPSDPDEGIFSPLPNGDDLETGSMPCAHKNDAVTDYEEVWHKLSLVPGPKRAWIIQSVENSPRGGTFLGRVAGSFMALRESEVCHFRCGVKVWMRMHNGM